MNESKVQYFHNTYIHCLSYYVIPTYVVYTFYNVHGTYTITKQLFRIRRVSGCFCLIVCLIQAAGLGSEIKMVQRCAYLQCVPRKGFGEVGSAVCDTIIHYISIPLTADPNSPNLFRGIHCISAPN